MTNTNVSNLEAIKAKIEAMKNAKKNVIVETVQLEGIVKDIHVPVSPKQIAIYVKLCTEKRVQLNPNYKALDGRKGGSMDREIQRLIKLPTIVPPSPAQIDLLKDICGRLNCEIPAYTHLTGGRGGTFSNLIGELIELEKEMTKVAPPTDKQLETILEMYFCPDVDFSDLHESYGITYTGAQGEKMLWTRPSQEAILDSILELVTFEMASNFIYKFQLDFYKWKTSRLSDGQMKRIAKLQESSGMKAMETHQLLQFSKEQANTYINDLNYVRRDVDLCKFPKEANIEHVYSSKDIAKAEKADNEAKVNVLFSLYAMMGMAGSDESDTGIDLTDNADIIIDLAKVCMEVCGSDAVLELLGTVYTEDELLLMFLEQEEPLVAI